MSSSRRCCEPDRVLQGRQSADDGDKKEFVTGESTKETVKTIAQGRPGQPGKPVVTTLVWFYFFHARLRVHWASGFPCALHFSRGKLSSKARAHRVARMPIHVCR